MMRSDLIKANERTFTLSFIRLLLSSRPMAFLPFPTDPEELGVEVQTGVVGFLSILLFGTCPCTYKL